jgi:DNA-directed RNA polymerase alpha subunit
MDMTLSMRRKKEMLLSGELAMRSALISLRDDLNLILDSMEENGSVIRPLYLNRKISINDLDYRTLSRLQNHGVNILNDLNLFSIQEYQQIRGIGRKSIDQIIKLANKHGVKIDGIDYYLSRDKNKHIKKDI